MKTWEKDFLRLALADHAFREADALAQHIIESKFPSESHLLSAAVAGVAVCYCRPFMSATGLGPLPPSMQEFAGAKNEQELRGAHLMIFEARHKLAAHFDRAHGEELHKAGVLPLSPSEVRINFQQHGFAVSTNAAYLNPEKLPAARDLFAFQMARVTSQLGVFGVQMLKKYRKLGEVVFKVP